MLAYREGPACCRSTVMQDINSLTPTSYAKHPLTDSQAEEVFITWRSKLYSRTQPIFILFDLPLLSEAGSPHSSLCFTCREESDVLIGCTTCCRSYHPTCLPSEPQRSQLWHWPGCLKREWHVATPDDSSAQVRVGIEDAGSRVATDVLPDALPTSKVTTSLAPTFRPPMAAASKPTTDRTEPEDADACDMTSLAQQGEEQTPFHNIRRALLLDRENTRPWIVAAHA